MTRQKQIVSVTLPPDVLQKLDRLAALVRMSRSACLSRLIDHHVANEMMDIEPDCDVASLLAAEELR